MSTGRVFDENQKKRYCELIGRGTRPRTAAEHLGFSWATVKKHLKTDDAFFELYEDSTMLANEVVESVLWDKATDDGDLGAIRFWLTNRYKDQWQETKTVQQQHVGPGGGPIQIVQGTVTALREVLDAPETREATLELMRDIPALGPGDDA